MLIRLTTLGAARVHRGDTGYPDLPAQRLRFALLLYLAVEQDVSRDGVVAMFWPDRDTARGKHALRQMLYELRQVLGEDWIEVRRDRIVVDAAVDALEFERAVEDGQTEVALRLYGGAFLQGFSIDNRSFEAWVDRRGGHLARLHRRLQREHIAQLIENDRPDDALAAARHWVELDPLDDEAVHTLLERFLAAGQRTAALQFYDHYERQLAAELQVEPLEETRTLIAAIRKGSAETPSDAAASADPHPASIRKGSADAPSNDSVPVDPHPAAVRSASVDRTPQPDNRTSEPDDRPSPKQSPQRQTAAAWRALSLRKRAMAAALVVAIAVAFGVYTRRTPGPAAALGYKTTIGVMPFIDNSGDESLAHLTGALTEALSRSLAQTSLLDVRSPNAIRQEREAGTPEDSLGRELNADYLVGGSIARQDDLLRMEVELIDGRTGQVVRSESFERSWSESRNLVEDVVRGAALFLRREVGTQIDVTRARAGTTNETAWRLLAEANAMHATIVELVAAGEVDAALRVLTTADSLLAISTRLDGEWAEPLLGRGWLVERRVFLQRRIRGTWSLDEVRRDLDAGLRFAAAAEETGQELAGVHALRSALLQQRAFLHESPDSVTQGLAAAEQELVLATSLDSLDQNAWSRLANLRQLLGRYGEAYAAAHRAYGLDPSSREASSLTYQLFNTLFETGRDREAEGWCFQGRRYFPGDRTFVYCLLALHAWGDPDVIQPQPELLRQELARFDDDDWRLQPHLKGRFETMIAAAYARAGQPDSARALLRRVADLPPDPGLLWMRASVHAALGEDSTALRLLDEHMANGSWAAGRVATSRPFWGLLSRTDLRQRIDRRVAAR